MRRMMMPLRYVSSLAAPMRSHGDISSITSALGESPVRSDTRTDHPIFRLSPAALREACFRMVRMTTPSPSAFDSQAFEGTAEYYAVGRPPYSAQLADTMARELSLDGAGQLLDVGCGPGVLELPLA